MSDEKTERPAVEADDGTPIEREKPEQSGAEERPDLKEHGKADSASGTDA
ncbi:hypothetical protein AB0J83_50055 [Actinoplanes sp. NPDC049596]